MLAHKNITKVIAAAMALAVCICLCAVAFSGQLSASANSSGISMEYETALFDTNEIIELNIIMDAEQWSSMLANAAAEEYCRCDVEINGSTFYNVAIRPKGNTSLTTIVNDPTTDRYSFKLEFDRYVDGQSCFGLDKLVLNNNYADATNMKEALVYDMYRFIGADASLYNYAKISVNGEYWGVYLALEAVEDSFLLRNYGLQSGALYKPESMGMGGGFSGNGGGADLNYSDDSLDSYSTIWDGEITDTGTADHKRVVSALKSISEGSELESCMDIDNLLRYMAVHVFSVNDDSLSGMMAHNYYLYESDGRLNLLPWDYNLAFGGMGMGSDASDVVNSAIDNAFSATGFFDTLMENSKYLDEYHSLMRRIVDEYIGSGGFEAFYNRVRGQLDPLVEADPTAFYEYDEYLTAADTLYRLVMLRAQSISGQLDGTIPSTEQAQRTSGTLIDASELDLSTLGGMNTGGFGGPMGSGNSKGGEHSGFGANSAAAEAFAGDGGENGFSPPEGSAAPDAGFSFDGSRMDFPLEMPDGAFPEGFPGEMQNGGFPGMPNGDGSGVKANSGLIIHAASLVIILAALAFAVFYRRRPRK